MGSCVFLPSSAGALPMCPALGLQVAPRTPLAGEQCVLLVSRRPLPTCLTRPPRHLRRVRGKPML